MAGTVKAGEEPRPTRGMCGLRSPGSGGWGGRSSCRWSLQGPGLQLKPPLPDFSEVTSLSVFTYAYAVPSWRALRIPVVFYASLGPQHLAQDQAWSRPQAMAGMTGLGHREAVGGDRGHSPTVVDEQTQQNEHEQGQGCQDGEQEDSVVGADVLDARCDGDQPCARRGLSIPRGGCPSWHSEGVHSPPSPSTTTPGPCCPPNSHQPSGRPWRLPSTPAEGR